MTTLSVTLVRGADGSVDENATLANCQSAVRKYVAERETETTQIAAAVAAVFDAHKGARLSVPFVKGATLIKLNAQPENHKTLDLRVAEYLRDNSGEGKLYSIGKGKGGGCARTADMPKPEATK